VFDQHPIPLRREVALEFIELDSTELHQYKLEIYEKKPSEKINLLKCIEFEPKKGAEYYLAFEVDANFDVKVNLCGRTNSIISGDNIIKSYAF